MKKITPIVMAVLLLSTCNRPVKLLEKGHTEKALKVSLKKLKSGKVKSDHLYVLEKSFLLETEKDAQKVTELRQKGNPALWLDIHKIAINMVKRQSKVSAIQNRLHSKGYFTDLEFYPAKALLKEAEEKVALFYYAKAQEFIPAAQNDDRLAARQAFEQLVKAKEYKPDFRDSELLSKEMHAIGTTHILLNPMEERNVLGKKLFNHFFNPQTFPERKNWEVFHITPPSNEDLDYRVDMNWDKIYVSWDDTNQYSCSNTKNVIDGYKEVRVWSERDSAYVIEQEPIFKCVSVTVNNYHQTKHAQVNLSCEVYSFETQELENTFAIRQSEDWSNEYSEIYGDVRALNFSCNNIGGCRVWFPSDWEMLKNASYDLSYRFKHAIDKEIN